MEVIGTGSFSGMNVTIFIDKALNAKKKNALVHIATIQGT